MILFRCNLRRLLMCADFILKASIANFELVDHKLMATDSSWTFLVRIILMDSLSKNYNQHKCQTYLKRILYKLCLI